MNKNIFEVKKLNIWYNGLQAIKDITVDIPANRITALIGASGSGKSTFLRSFNRMLDTVSGVRIEGEILYHKSDIYNPQTDVTALRREVGMVFQNPIPFPKSIYDNIAYGLEINGMAPKKSSSILGKIFNNKISGDDIEKSKHPLDKGVCWSLKEAALWEEVKNRLHESAFRLSGGQQQRLCIARAIAVKPTVLLLDEPASELDPIATRKIEELIMELKNNYTVVIVTHNMQQAKRISDYVAFFHLGELVEFNSVLKIFECASHPLTCSYVRGEFG